MPADIRPTAPTATYPDGPGVVRLLCPFDLHVDVVGRFLNAELDDPVYSGAEVQGFDDDAHGRGVLVFLQRRSDRLVDYYHSPGLRLDRRGFTLGAGTNSWQEVGFDVARLEVDDRGVDAEVRFRDRDGRPIEIRVLDRGRRPRRRATMLAPVGSGIDDPTCLLLVHLHGFDLVHRGATPPTIRIDGRDAATGSLPGGWLHRRHLVKTCAPLHAIRVNASSHGEVAVVDPSAVDRISGSRVEVADGRIVALGAGVTPASARLELEPGLPALDGLADGAVLAGRWLVRVPDVPPLTGGTWTARRTGDEVVLSMDVTDRWRSGRLPLLFRLVSRAVPVFRRWPTTYRWDAVLTLREQPTMTGRWRRTGEPDDSYAAATRRR